jgi:hypothetical protein
MLRNSFQLNSSIAILNVTKLNERKKERKAYTKMFILLILLHNNPK